MVQHARIHNRYDFMMALTSGIVAKNNKQGGNYYVKGCN